MPGSTSTLSGARRASSWQTDSTRKRSVSSGRWAPCCSVEPVGRRTTLPSSMASFISGQVSLLYSVISRARTRASSGPMVGRGGPLGGSPSSGERRPASLTRNGAGLSRPRPARAVVLTSRFTDGTDGDVPPDGARPPRPDRADRGPGGPGGDAGGPLPAPAADPDPGGAARGPRARDGWRADV